MSGSHANSGPHARREVDGVCRLFASTEATDAVTPSLLAALGDHDPSAVLCFAGSAQDLGRLHQAIREQHPETTVAGCSTAGEIGLLGCTSAGISAIAFDPSCRASATLIDPLGDFRFDSGLDLVTRLAADIGRGVEELVLDAGRFVFLVFSDGLSGLEEVLIASLATYVPGAAIVGGSAGDDFQFQRTWVGANGRVVNGGAVVVLLEPGREFHAFHLHHFEPTERSVVVTEADPEQRIVGRLDGKPALDVLCELLGMSREEFGRDPQATLISHQPVFGFHAGGEIYMRSVMSVRGTSLLMGGATERGTVLHQMRAGDLIAETRSGLERECAGVDDPAALLLFNCGGRLWEAQSAGKVDALGEVFRHLPAAGFTTYGEQCGPMQVNHTLTGLVLGR